MRVRLRIERNSLPPVQTLWPVKDPTSTIAQLLQQINDIFPLEADTWGLEDYTLTLGAYELLHYHVAKDVLKEEDELLIRPLKWEELKSRLLTGRNQISPDGRHLVDGVPFGRPALRAPTRPEVRIPPRKKRKLSNGEELVNGVAELAQGQAEDENAAPLLLKEGPHEGLAEGDGEEEEDSDYVSIHSDSSGTPSDHASSSEEDSSDDSSASDSEHSSSDSSSESDESDSGKGITNGGSPPSKLGNAAPNGAPPSRKKDTPPSNGGVRSGKDFAHHGDADKPRLSEQTSEAGLTGSPNESRSRTHARNARRRDSKRLKFMKSSGAVPQSTTLAEYRNLVHNNGAEDTSLNADADDEADEVTLSGGQAAVNGKREISAATSHTQAAETGADALQLGDAGRAASETPATKKKKQSKNTKPTLETSAKLQEQRQQLVEAIASGGIDVNGIDGTQEEAGAPDELTSRDQATVIDRTTKSTTAMVPRSVTGAAGRAKLDIAGSKRLLFGSLGVRVPKTQQEKDALQRKLAEGAKRKAVRPTAATPVSGDVHRTTSTKQLEPGAADDASWRDRISLTAVECVDEDVMLSEPPFPFHQRWDPQYNRRGKKRESSTYTANGGKKRKRGQQQHTDESYDKYNTDGYGDALNYDEEEDDEYWEDGALLDGEGDEDGEGDDEGSLATDKFPALPSDLTTLPLLKSSSDARIGDIVTFTELACDATTGWQPKMTARTVKILELPDAGEEGAACRVQFSERDVKAPAFDEEGNRIWDKFEMPGGENDERVRDVFLGEVGDVRVVLRAG